MSRRSMLRRMNAEKKAKEKERKRLLDKEAKKFFKEYSREFKKPIMRKKRIEKFLRFIGPEKAKELEKRARIQTGESESWIHNAPLPKNVYRATTAERAEADVKGGAIEPTVYSRHPGWGKHSPKAVYGFAGKAEFKKFKAPREVLEKFNVKNKGWIDSIDWVMREKQPIIYEPHPMEIAIDYSVIYIPEYRTRDETRKNQLFKREREKFSKETPVVQKFNFEKFAKDYQKRTKMKVYLIEDMEMNKGTGAVMVINEKGEGVRIPKKFVSSIAATDFKAYEEASRFRRGKDQETIEEYARRDKEAQKKMAKMRFKTPLSEKQEIDIRIRELEISDKEPFVRLRRSLRKNLEEDYIKDLAENIGMEEAMKERKKKKKKKIFGLFG